MKCTNHLLIQSFPKKYAVDRLVYDKLHEDAEAAIKRERRIKEWPRQWKIDLIEKQNETWVDLYDEII